MASDPIHQGNSLVPLLKKGASEWPYMARTSIGPGNYSIVSKNYRFIQYNDNTAELYDRINDPNEWYNLINNPDLSDVIEEHRNKIPNQRHEILGDGSLGHESYSFSEKSVLYPKLEFIIKLPKMRVPICNSLFFILLELISNSTQGQLTPENIKFTRQGVQRMIFDEDQSITISKLNPKILLD